MATAAQLLVKVSGDTGDAERKLRDVNEHVGKSGGFFKTALQNALGFASGAAIVSGVGTAISFVTSNIGDMITAGAQANQVQAQTIAGLKSTHGAAGMTADAIGNLATKTMNLTGIDDDSVQSAENMLLTFTNIGKNVFPLATQSVADLATKMNNGAIPSQQQMQQASVLLGKALNDPLTGLTALTRVGVTFNDQQKEQIQKMMQAGNLAGAQKIILAEMNKEFGGSAEAAGKANGGMAIFSATLGNMKESIGQAIIPILSGLMQSALPLVQTFGAFLPGAIATLQTFLQANLLPIVNRLSDWFTTQGLPALMNFGDFVMSTVVPALQNFAGFVEKNVIPVVLQLAQWFAANLLPVIQTLANVFLTNVLPALQGVWTSISENLIPAVEKLWTKIGPLLIPIFQLLGWILQHIVGPAIGLLINILGHLIDIIATVIGKIGDFLGRLGFLKDHGIDMIKKAFSDLGSHIASIWDGITASIRGAVNSIIDIINGLIDRINSIRIHVPKIDLPGGGSLGGNDISFPQLPHIPHLASGGSVTDAGLALVGEYGPEVLALPRGASVVPLSGAGSGAGSGIGGNTYHVNVYPAQSSLTEDGLMRELRWQELLHHG